MKSKLSIRIVAITVLAALGVVTQLAAEKSQQAQPQEHIRYKLVVIGTFGGPNSYVTFVSQTLNTSGTTTGCSDTPMALSPPFCLIDCFATHTFEWKDGTVVDLGALQEVGSSGPNYVTARGVVVGSSFNGGVDPALGLPCFDAIVFKDGQVLDLGTFGDPLSYAAALNDSDQVVGFALNSAPDAFDLGHRATGRYILFLETVRR